MKSAFITTVLNEEKTIVKLLESLLRQKNIPNEVIIVDGGSTDETLTKIQNYKARFNNKSELKIILKPGNRAAGRNEAIKQAKSEIILCSDSGCILDENWVSEIIKPFKNENTDVVAGFYKGKWDNIFQKCLIPYVLTMPDKVNKNEFLPATRSMAFRKRIWKKTGGFNEALSHNEDYEFARRIKEMGINIIFQESAIVYWLPRKKLKEAFVMFYRFAYGDIEAGILRHKVLILFMRYILGFLIGTLYLTLGLKILINILSVILIFYIIYSIYKNYKYIKDIRAFYYLPLLQFTADIAVLSGSVSAALEYLYKRKSKQTKLSD